MAVDSSSRKTVGPGKRVLSSYERVRDWISHYRLEHELGSGARIPSERTIAGELGLSRPTVTRAVVRLAKEGVLVREERSGTFIKGQSVPQRSFNKFHTIGLVMPWLSQAPGNDGENIVPESPPSSRPHVPFSKETMSLQVAHGAFAVLKEFKCHIVLHSDGTPEEEFEALTHMANECVDGIIVMPGFSSQNASRYAALASSGVSLVFIDHYFPNVEADHVVTDNFAGARDTVRHIISRGHKRIAYFTEFSDVTSVVDREAGYRAALEEAGIPYDENIVRGPEMTRDCTYVYELALGHCRSMPKPITAVFCLNDDAILATMYAASKLGISIPGDLEVAGFYDDIPDELPTPFTRVVQQKVAMGRAAAQMLIKRISGKAPTKPEHITLPAEILPRG